MDPYQQGRRRDGDRLLFLEEPIGGIEWPRQGVTCTPRPSPKVRMRSISEPTLAPRTEATLPLLTCLRPRESVRRDVARDDESGERTYLIASDGRSDCCQGSPIGAIDHNLTEARCDALEVARERPHSPVFLG